CHAPKLFHPRLSAPAHSSVAFYNMHDRTTICLFRTICIFDFTRAITHLPPPEREGQSYAAPAQSPAAGEQRESVQRRDPGKHVDVALVESAAKAKTINKCLGANYKAIPSFGHVRDLPSKGGSVEPDRDFAMHWDVDAKANKVMREIADAVKKADKLILATDPDQIGRAHV